MQTPSQNAWGKLTSREKLGGTRCGESNSVFRKSSVSEEKDTRKVIYGNETGLDTLGVWVLVPSEKAEVGKEHAAILLQ